MSNYPGGDHPGPAGWGSGGAVSQPPPYPGHTPPPEGRGGRRGIERVALWLRIAFGGFIAVLGVMIASLQWVEASNANEREELRTYREQAKTCGSTVMEYTSNALIAANQVGREAEEFELPPYLTPSYINLDRMMGEAILCDNVASDFVTEPGEMSAIFMEINDSIVSAWSNQPTESGNHFKTSGELIQYIEQIIQPVIGHLQNMWLAGLYGPDWPEYRSIN